MKRSTDHILTTHVGSLVRPPELIQLMRVWDRPPAQWHALARRGILRAT
ncbi:MAG: hypothetical protein HYU30_07800 [Chloroflexi bacterium]|nr:hypothetical protein [Chloroflexota bacterium]